MAPSRGIVIKIDADAEGAKAALQLVRDEMRRTAEAAEGSASSVGRVGGALDHAVPPMAAASAGLRALEGNFTNNIRAGERFLSMLPGVAPLLTAAFPAIGLTVLATALVNVSDKAHDTYENIFQLKGVLDELGQVDLVVAKRLETNADAIENALEKTIERTQGKVAAMRQKLSYEGQKPIDLSEIFYDKNVSGLPDRIKANYENLYKSVAPADLPDRMRRITKEASDLNAALQSVRNGTGAPDVSGFGPKVTESWEKYYEVGW